MNLGGHTKEIMNHALNCLGEFNKYKTPSHGLEKWEREVGIKLWPVSQQQATQHEKDKDADHYEDAYLLIVPGVVLGERHDGKVTETTEDTWSVTPASNLTKDTEDAGSGPMSYNMAVRGAVLGVFKQLEHHAVSLAVHNTGELRCI